MKQLTSTATPNFALVVQLAESSIVTKEVLDWADTSPYAKCKPVTWRTQPFLIPENTMPIHPCSSSSSEAYVDSRRSPSKPIFLICSDSVVYLYINPPPYFSSISWTTGAYWYELCFLLPQLPHVGVYISLFRLCPSPSLHSRYIMQPFFIHVIEYDNIHPFCTSHLGWHWTFLLQLVCTEEKWWQRMICMSVKTWCSQWDFKNNEWYAPYHLRYDISETSRTYIRETRSFPF